LYPICSTTIGTHCHTPLVVVFSILLNDWLQTTTGNCSVHQLLNLVSMVLEYGQMPKASRMLQIPLIHPHSMVMFLTISH